MSKKTKTALIVVALLVGIAGFNYIIQMDPTQLAARGVGQEPHSHDEHEHEGEGAAPTLEEMQEPVGPEDAPVRIQVLWNDPQELQGLIRPMLSAVATSYDDRVRVEFVEPQSDEFQTLVEEKTGGVTSGLLINGEMIKKVPEADLGMLAFTGSPAMQDWGEPELRLAIEHELEAAGVPFEAQVEHDHSHAAPSPAADPHAGHDH
ncbi:MAG: hypothetical protein ACOCX2_04800 [Armatimonadota bacterium]